MLFFSVFSKVSFFFRFFFSYSILFFSLNTYRFFSRFISYAVSFFFFRFLLGFVFPGIYEFHILSFPVFLHFRLQQLNFSPVLAYPVFYLPLSFARLFVCSLFYFISFCSLCIFCHSLLSIPFSFVWTYSTLFRFLCAHYIFFHSFRV